MAVPKYYVLVNHVPHPVSLKAWVAVAATRRPTEDPWRVAFTDLTDTCYVSTVFLGTNHRFLGKGPPLLFESMVFGGPTHGEMRRYSTWDDAEIGHQAMVARARKEIANA
jgi:hypothetical protein